MNLDEKRKRIAEEKKRKYLLPRSKQIFHYGIIILISLAIGLIYFQFDPVTSADIAPSDLNRLRKGFGIFLSSIIGVGGGFLYLIWTVWRVYKCQKEINKEIMMCAIKEIEKK